MIEGDPEGNIENSEDVEMELGLSIDLFRSRDTADEVESFRSLEDMIAMRAPLVDNNSGEAAPPVRRVTKCWPLIRGPRQYEGESSSGVVGGGSSGGSSSAIDDLQHKRAKVLASP